MKNYFQNMNLKKNAAMGLNVSFQVVAIDKVFVTQTAVVRLLPSVNYPVHDNVGRVREILATQALENSTSTTSTGAELVTRNSTTTSCLRSILTFTQATTHISS